MSSVLSEVESVFAERKASQLARYRKLVADVVDSKKTPTQEVVEILDSVGRTPAQLQLDATLLKQRREWRSKLDAEPGQQSRSAELNAEIEKLGKQFEQDSKKLSDELQAAVHPLRLERDRLVTEVHQASLHDYRNKLLQSGDGYEAAKEVWDNMPDRKVSTDLERELEIAQGLVRQAAYDRDMSRRASGSRIPFFDRSPASKKDQEEEQALASAKARVAEIEKQIAADKAGWEAHRERGRQAEDRLKVPENFKLAI